MKKLLFISMLLTSTGLMAQKFQVGVKAGVNISQFNGTFEDVSTKSLVGFHGGGFIGFLLGNNLSIQPEVLFSTQGMKLEDAQTGKKEDFKVNYVNIPVLVKYRFNGGFYLETGPQVGFKTSAKVGDQSVNDAVKGSDFSWAAGLGFHSKMGLGIGARYNVGLTKVGDVENGGVFSDPDYKNSVIQIGLFYTFFNNH